jgi:hypothetical protein
MRSADANYRDRKVVQADRKEPTMPELRWRTRRFAARDQDYLVSASRLPATTLLTLPRFLYYTLKVTGQLKHSAGLIAYSLKADIPGRRFWTLALWQDEPALRAFVRGQPHAEIMRRLAPTLRDPRFAQWTTRSAESLPPWLEVEARLNAA